MKYFIMHFEWLQSILEREPYIITYKLGCQRTGGGGAPPWKLPHPRLVQKGGVEIPLMFFLSLLSFRNSFTASI